MAWRARSCFSPALNRPRTLGAVSQGMQGALPLRKGCSGHPPARGLSTGEKLQLLKALPAELDRHLSLSPHTLAASWHRSAFPGLLLLRKSVPSGSRSRSARPQTCIFQWEKLGEPRTESSSSTNPPQSSILRLHEAQSFYVFCLS